LIGGSSPHSLSCSTFHLTINFHSLELEKEENPPLTSNAIETGDQHKVPRNRVSSKISLKVCGNFLK
jgi:hypothetical protein